MNTQNTRTLQGVQGAERISSQNDLRLRTEEHFRLLTQLDQLPLSDSCCELCHCDCYSSHRSSDYSAPLDSPKQSTKIKLPTEHQKNKIPIPKLQNDDECQAIRCRTRKKKITSNARNSTLPRMPKSNNAKRSLSTSPMYITPGLKRSKSTSSLQPHKSKSSQLSPSKHHFTRDCEILQHLCRALQDDHPPQMEITSKTLKPSSNSGSQLHKDMSLSLGSTNLDYNKDRSVELSATNLNQNGVTGFRLGLKDLQLCESMANLCLVPTVRQAFQQVSTHDQKILNRMARKRSEKVTAKETAWLARKYWENERFERQLLQCEQAEEYKRAVRDKQFQDMQMTKARLNEIAQRDWAELQRLRELLQHKETHAQRRLAAVRVERDLLQCQRRCEELRRNEAVNLQQEEQLLEDSIRKKQLCQRLGNRLQRAQQVRAHLLDSYLRRLRHDNYNEQLLHEAHWRETQATESMKREQLKEHISRKCIRTKAFVENRRRELAAIVKTAKISASLRELVRTSVTPEAASAAVESGPMHIGVSSVGVADGVPISLSKLLREQQ